MSVYMKSFKDLIGYTSLKEQYSKKTAKLFNKMEDNNACTTPEDMDKYVSENWDDIDIEKLTKEDPPSEEDRR